MNTTLLKIFAVLSLLFTVACEVPASSGTVEVTIEGLSSRDIDDQGRLIFAVAAVNSGACATGPCSPNPCSNDQTAVAQGRTACIGRGDQHQCVCPPGQYEDTEGGTGNCIPETTCAPSNRTCGGPPMFPSRGSASMDCTEGNIICNCNLGYMGTFCGECNEAEGFIRDGEGFCSLPAADEAPCRDGQGTEAFQQLIAQAEESLGHAPVELELEAARMEVIAGSANEVRSWPFLFNGPVTLFVQTVSGFPSNAGIAEIPAVEVGLEPLDFDMSITRSQTSEDPQFRDGDFRVGISGPTDLLPSENFRVDLKLILDFNAY